MARDLQRKQEDLKMDKEAKKIVHALRCERCIGNECEYHTETSVAALACDWEKYSNDAADLIEAQAKEIDDLREKLGKARLGMI